MRLFMSHSANDKPLVDALQNLLRDVFAEPVEIASSSASVADGGVGAGEDWLDWIDKQVQRSDMTIVVLTPTSRRRPWLAHWSHTRARSIRPLSIPRPRRSYRRPWTTSRSRTRSRPLRAAPCRSLTRAPA